MVPMGMGSKSPNLQATNPNAVQSSLANSLGGGGGVGPMGGNSMVMSIASNGNQQPMSSMQGKRGEERRIVGSVFGVRIEGGFTFIF